MQTVLSRLNSDEREKFLEILNYGESSDEEFNLYVANDHELSSLLDLASNSHVVSNRLYRELSREAVGC